MMYKLMHVLAPAYLSEVCKCTITAMPMLELGCLFMVISSKLREQAFAVAGLAA